MSKTKKKILDASRTLFNKHGYSQVTIRMIAQHIGISSGNLNYHFKIRDSILEELYFEMVAVFDARVANLGKQEITIQSIKSDIVVSMERMVEYRFFWTDLYNLLSQNSKIREHFDQVYSQRLNGYKFLFNYLIDKEIMMNASFSGEHEVLAKLLIDQSNTWIYSSTLYQKQNLNEFDIPNQAYRLMFMLYPYLTKKGKADFISIFPKNS
ncbi:MAG: TetR/AcrR family transcriptional regulator [Balneolaceae bacterium]